MIDQDRLSRITAALLEFTPTVPNSSLFPTLVPEAAPLIETDPYAFLIAVCLDRGTKADVIWTIPYDIKIKLGHLDPQLIYKMSLDELAELLSQLPHKPRYVNDAPKTIRDLTRFVVEECSGDASLVWEGRRAADVNRILRSIHGVGSGIANMGVLLIEKAFGVRFRDLDRHGMDIKPDVHTVRVLYRLGASEAETIEAALSASRLMNPSFPGGLDGGLWEIGRRWCFASNPNCNDCPTNKDCARLIKNKWNQGTMETQNGVGQLTVEFGLQIREALNGKGFRVFIDHASLEEEDAGRIVSWFEKPYGRPTQLSYIDIAIVQESSHKIVVLIEIEETNGKPKTYLGDMLGILMGEYIRCRNDEEILINENATLFVFGKSEVSQKKRNDYIRGKVMKIKPLLSTANSRISDIVIEDFSTNNELFNFLPSVLDRAFKGQL